MIASCNSDETVATWCERCLNVKNHHLIVPILWVMAAPMLDRAAEVTWPAWERVSWVFLYLWSGQVKRSGDEPRGENRGQADKVHREREKEESEEQKKREIQFVSTNDSWGRSQSSETMWPWWCLHQMVLCLILGNEVSIITRSISDWIHCASLTAADFQIHPC